jgi:CheY-like chemotaxis protein
MRLKAAQTSRRSATDDTEVSPRLPPHVAHDLREQISIVLVALRLLEMGDQGAKAQAVGMVRSAMQEMSDLIDSLSGTVRPKRTTDTAAVRRGTRVLVVEDEYLLAQSVSDHLTRAGCNVVGPVGTVEGALNLLPEHDLDCAIVDANLNGEFSTAVLEALAAQGVPAMILSGYDQAAMPNALKALPFLQKPVQESELIKMVGELAR